MTKFTSVSRISLLYFAVFSTQLLANNLPVSYKEIDYINPQTKEPLKLSIWYPSGESCINSHLCLAENTKFKQGIILTHGAMGSAKEMNWIGYATASQGFVTIGVNHFGESWVYGKDNIKPETASKLWDRPVEVSTVLDILQENTYKIEPNKALFSKNVDWENVTAIGFSSGGSTVISLAGGIYKPENALDYCRSEKSINDLGCKYVKEGSKKTSFSIKAASASYLEPRVKRIIALDPAAGYLTSVESLRKINIPTLIIGAKQNDFLPFEIHAAYYSANIYGAKLVTLNNGEGHFVFLDKCSHQYKAMGVSICKDKDGIDRDTVHKQLYKDLFSFIYMNQ